MIFVDFKGDDENLLNHRQKKFCDEYILNGGNATSAAKSAGYAESCANRSASRLMQNPEIRQEIDSRLAAASSAKTLDERQLLEFLSAVVRGEVTDQTTITKLTGKGTSTVEVIELRAQTAQRIKAAETLAKIFGMFKRNDDDIKADGASLFISTLSRVWSAELDEPEKAAD